MKIDERGTLYHESIGERGEIAFEKTNDHGLLMLGSQIVTQIFSVALKVIPNKYKQPIKTITKSIVISLQQSHKSIKKFITNVITTPNIIKKLYRLLIIDIKSIPDIVIGSMLIFIQNIYTRPSVFKTISKIKEIIITITQSKLIGKFLFFTQGINISTQISKHITKTLNGAISIYFNVAKRTMVKLYANIQIAKDFLRSILKVNTKQITIDFGIVKHIEKILTLIKPVSVTVSFIKGRFIVFIKGISVNTIFSKIRQFRHTAAQTVIKTVKKYTNIKLGD